MPILLGLEVVALSAVASRLPAVRATAREAGNLLYDTLVGDDEAETGDAFHFALLKIIPEAGTSAEERLRVANAWVDLPVCCGERPSTLKMRKEVIRLAKSGTQRRARRGAAHSRSWGSM